MVTKSITIPKDCEIILDKMKQKNPYFNFSGFIQNIIRTKSEKKFKKEDVIRNINERKVLIMKSENEIQQLNLILEKLSKEATIQQQVQANNLKHQEERQKIEDYLSDLSDNPEKLSKYKEGIVLKKWRGSLDFATQMLEEEECQQQQKESIKEDEQKNTE